MNTSSQITPRAKSKKGVEQEVRADKRRLYLLVTGGIVAGCLFLTAFLHGYNVYPGFYASNLAKQLQGKEVWENTCGGGTRTASLSPALIRCSEAHEWSQISVHAVAWEESIKHVFGDLLGVFHYTPCGPGSACAYWMWRMVETLIGSFYTVLVFVFVIICALLYIYHNLFTTWQKIRRKEQVYLRDAPTLTSPGYSYDGRPLSYSTVRVEEIRDDDSGESMRWRTPRADSPQRIESVVKQLPPAFRSSAYLPPFAVKLGDIGRAQV